MNHAKLALDRKTIQELLGISQSAFYKLVKLGYLRPLPGIKNHKIYSYAELLRYCDGQTPKQEK